MTTAGSTGRDSALAGQTIVVIGGSAGIGLETARKAHAEGAGVILIGRSAERLERAALDVGAQRTAAFDANDPDSLQSFFQDLPAPIDHVMVTAGAPLYGPPLEMSPEAARRGLTEHLMLALNVARAAAHKVRPAGSLVFMGGTGARRPRAGLAIASTATVAFPTPIANLALELAPGPRQPDRRRLRRYAPVGRNSWRRPRQATRGAPRDVAYPAGRRARATLPRSRFT